MTTARVPELTVYDEEHACHYLPDETARLPLRFPIRKLSPAEVDASFAAGDRRQGSLLYRTECARCHACEPIRVDVPAFRENKTQRRVLVEGDRAFSVTLARPSYSDDKLALYEKHKRGRGLETGDGALDPRGYRAFLVDSCCDSYELQLRDRATGALVAVAIADRGRDALSAVYCHWDPTYAKRSPGAFAILREIALCREWGLRHLYLGLYVVGNAHMAYKARWLPHERRIGREWRRFER